MTFETNVFNVEYVTYVTYILDGIPKTKTAQSMINAWVPCEGAIRWHEAGLRKLRWLVGGLVGLAHSWESSDCPLPSSSHEFPITSAAGMHQNSTTTTYPIIQ